jgi:hypothetical protein
MERTVDWAEKKAREIVGAYRPFFRGDAPTAAEGLINLVAGELRGSEETARREAIAVGETMLAALKRLSCA